MKEIRKRDSNIELLRLVAMVMVVLMHYLSKSENLIAPLEPLSASKVIGSFLESLSLVAVNVYIFISGYYGSISEFKYSKAIKLLCQIWFYAFSMLGMVALFKKPTVASEGIHGLVKYVFPIESEHYWFATSFLILYLLTPVLNHAIRSLSQKEIKLVLAGLLLFFCGIKSISPVPLAIDKYGYDLPWFICVYLLAGYLHKYGCSFLEKNRFHGLWLYLGCSGFGYGLQFMMYGLTKLNLSFAYYFTVPYHYNFVGTLLGAVGLFYFAKGIRIPEGKGADLLRKIGPLSFGIYLLHEQIDVRNLWYPTLTKLVNPKGYDNFFFFTAELWVSIILICGLGLAVDLLRDFLFRFVTELFAKKGETRE